jgi:hypothetical protein
VASIFYAWRAHTFVAQRRRLLHERVAMLLWAVANHA